MKAIRGLTVVRGGVGVPRVADRAAKKTEDAAPPEDGRLGTLEVNFSKFNTWYRIDSYWEGTFLERTVPGSFKRTIANNGSNVKVLFNHGFDLNIGDKVLSVPEVIEERKDSPYLEGPLFDTSYNRDLMPGLRAGAYGSSFMFEVLNEQWNYEPDVSDYNPDGLPERTITEVRLHEAGPVTWPANPDATASLRSGSDWFAEQVAKRDDDRYGQLVKSFAAFRAYHNLGSVAEQNAPEPVTSAPGIEPARHVDGVTAAARKRRLLLIDLAGKNDSGRAS